MERCQLTEQDRQMMNQAAVFGFEITPETELTAKNTDSLADAMVEAREHLATTADTVAYIVIRVA